MKHQDISDAAFDKLCSDFEATKQSELAIDTQIEELAAQRTALLKRAYRKRATDFTALFEYEALEPEWLALNAKGNALSTKRHQLDHRISNMATLRWEAQLPATDEQPAQAAA